MRLVSRVALCTALAPTAFAASAQDGVGGIPATNESDLTVSYLYASSCQEDEWGDDVLGSDVLASSAHLDVPLDAGCRDLEAIAADGQEVETDTVGLAADDDVVWTADEE